MEKKYDHIKAFLLGYAGSSLAKLRRNEVLFLGPDKLPVAAIRRDGSFMAAKQDGGRVWFSYAPEALEKQFCLDCVRFSDRKEVCRDAVAPLWCAQL